MAASPPSTVHIYIEPHKCVSSDIHVGVRLRYVCIASRSDAPFPTGMAVGFGPRDPGKALSIRRGKNPHQQHERDEESRKRENESYPITLKTIVLSASGSSSC